MLRDYENKVIFFSLADTVMVLGLYRMGIGVEENIVARSRDVGCVRG